MTDLEILEAIMLENRDSLPTNLDDRTLTISPLGSGESNDNYIVGDGGGRIVLRVAKGRRNRLTKEFRTLKQIPAGIGPKPYFYSETNGLDVLAEEYIEGEHVRNWDDSKIKRLVSTVSKLHETKSATADIRDEKVEIIDLEHYIEVINRPFLEDLDTSLIDDLQTKIRTFCLQKQMIFNSLKKFTLIHADLAPANSIFNAEADQLRLIDWEFAQFFDPARDFATFFYNGTDYNDGNWRVSLNESQQDLLVIEYEKLTGENIDERLKVWLVIDKYNSVVYLNWKIINFNSTDRVTLSRDTLAAERDKLVESLLNDLG